MSAPVLYLDGPNLTMRALHASLHPHGPMSSGNVDTGALTIFLNVLGKLVREEGPDRMAIAWDSPLKGFRYTLHEGYKGHRNDAPIRDAKESAFGLVRRFCDLAGIRSAEWPTLEADDIIACCWNRETQGPIVIASNDHDFLQLAGLNPQGVDTQIVRFGDETRWDEKRVSKQYDSPAHYPLIAALAGDASDNIPGIRGIGPKKAVALLKKYSWDLEAALDEYPHERENVRTFFDMINLRDMPAIRSVEAMPLPTGVLNPELVEFLEHYELRGALGKLRAGTFWRPIPYRRPSQ